jgi:orotate phosphoribosyltransferase
MDDLKKRTVELLIKHGALKFGDFVLKSGRRSPYFINIGEIADGSGLNELGEILADKIVSDIGVDSFDVLFGPAYKGIPLASAASVYLFSKYDKNKGFAFDRKEAKGHGEAGIFIGMDLTEEKRKILIVDDVFTDGKTKVDTIEMIAEATKSSAVGIIVVVDRMERDAGGEIFSKVVSDKTKIPVYSVITLKDIIDYVRGRGLEALGIEKLVFDAFLGLEKK